MLTSEEVSNRYPIHWLVWNNHHEELKTTLDSHKFSEEEIEKKDPRGRTPLLLAVTLGHLEAVQTLLDAGADVNCEKDGWTAVQEATATSDPELLSLVLSTRDYRRQVQRADGIPELLNKLSLAPDFYVEMRWEFTSWMPLVSRMCPFDTYKVYKRGANVRVDTTLVGFEQNKWQRGHRTYIFRGQGRTAKFSELDHELGTQWTECLGIDEEHPFRPVSARAVAKRLQQPIASTYLDTDKISFERNKSGVWGWRQDKTENVNGYECKVFGANNVELISSTRVEHVPERRRDRVLSPRAPLAGLLSLGEEEEAAEEEPLIPPQESQKPECRIPWENYFSGEELEDDDLVRPRILHTKVQRFKATLWLCEDYPLQLQEQIMPILDLMASLSSPHFAKLKDFIQMQLPAGFPVKIEIPLFHVLNARVTFGNIFGLESVVTHVSTIAEGDRLSCVVDDDCFRLPPHYRDLDDHHLPRDNDDAFLQDAIHQSLLDGDLDQVDVWEALRGARPGSPGAPAAPGSPAGPADASDMLRHEDALLQRAIEASLANLSTPLPPPCPEDGIERALRESAREQEANRQLLIDEQRLIDEAIRLSMLEQ